VHCLTKYWSCPAAAGSARHLSQPATAQFGMGSTGGRPFRRCTLTSGRQLNARSVGRHRSQVMQDTDLFVALAEIAGVFVGFGALISVTRRGGIDATPLAQIRAVVAVGLLVIVAALIPVGLDRYGLTGHTVWSWSSFTFLLLIWVSIFVHRASLAAQARANPVSAMFFWVGLEVPIQVPLVLAVFGSHPTLEPAFYTTALILNLFEAAFLLTQLVFAHVVAAAE
jgi:hypothetical protein